MTDYSAPAELYAIPRTGTKRHMAYWHFSTAAEALKFAIETRPALSNVVLEIDEDRFDGASILEMYKSDAFPLARSDKFLRPVEPA